MGTINKVTLKGRLGKEPSWGTLPSGALACRLLLATTAFEDDNSTGNARRCTEWHRAVLEGRLAEQVRDRLAKGDEVYIEGGLKTRTWTDGQGIARYCTEVFAQNVQVFPQLRARCATLAESELLAWVSDYDEATAREAAAKEEKDKVVRQHLASFRSRPRRGLGTRE
ncbi:single-stranded DNA-binding protein [Massilia sp. CCM 8734]|uniref:single-stranded DNA-binding protein n=1 Tax=Massilia sp. CCM 8734 TaxID=2609283 RepID=UPI00141EF696|nr:single-stranded DNA-binding protein [Massilia sp. CCM 8734]NHZ99025.1 single-stranded DNA-binding protein [Massilia sp. CCM 8734]